MEVAVPLTYHIPPLVAIAGYVAYPKNFRINPTLLHVLSVVHNAFLVAFSAWTFVSLAQVLYTDGIVFQSNYYFKNPQFETAIYYFYISKYYEFFDTFLLYLKGKSPIFLQKYHHIGAVICWHLTYVYKVDVIWIPSIANALVHTIMYSYYLGCLLKMNQVRFIKQYITSLQLAQLIIPNAFCLYLYAPPVESVFNYGIIIFFDAYVFVLILLFLRFFYLNYIKN